MFCTRDKSHENEKVNWISIPIKEEETEVHSVCSVAGWGKAGY